MLLALNDWKVFLDFIKLITFSNINNVNFNTVFEILTANLVQHHNTDVNQ